MPTAKDALTIVGIHAGRNRARAASSRFKHVEDLCEFICAGVVFDQPVLSIYLQDKLKELLWSEGSGHRELGVRALAKQCRESLDMVVVPVSGDDHPHARIGIDAN
jgi:hypothetical protein